MADALRAGHQRVKKLFGFQAAVAVDVLKPFCRVARGVLDFQHLDRAQGFVALQRFGRIRLRGKTVRQFNRILQRELGAAADRKVRRVRGVTHQHDGYPHAPHFV